MLLQEKEQLLRELKGINPKGRSQVEMKGIQTRISQLEYDLNVAVEISNKQIADRCVWDLERIKEFNTYGALQVHNRCNHLQSFVL
jgi:hypothetical protein